MTRQHPVLAGLRVLVVEDDFIIATEMVDLLETIGAVVLGPVPTIAEARGMLGQAGLPQLAVLDVNLCGERVWPLADQLVEADVTTVLTTGFGPDAIPTRFIHLPRCEKPYSLETMLKMLSKAVSDRVTERASSRRSEETSKTAPQPPKAS